MRLAVTRELAAWLADRIAAYPAESPPQLKWLAEFAAQAGALPLYLGWFETIGLRPDGEVVSWSTEGEYPGTKRLGGCWAMLSYGTLHMYVVIYKFELFNYGCTNDIVIIDKQLDHVTFFSSDSIHRRNEPDRSP